MKSNKKIYALLLAVCMVLTSFNIPGLQLEAEAAEAKVIDVTDFGADPSGASDSAEAIIEAVAAAKEASEDGEVPVTIEFPEGRYDIYPDKAQVRELYISNTVGADQSYKNKKIGILLEDMKNITVEGNDSLFMFHGKMMTFATIRCENVTFRNFTVDFEVPTVLDLTVEKINGNKAVIYVPECYNYEVTGNTTVQWSSDVSPYTGQPYWTSVNSFNYTQRYNMRTGVTWRGNTWENPIFANATKITDMGNHRLEITYSSLHGDMTEGLCCQSRPTVRDHSGTFFWECKDITLEHLDIQYIHGFGMVGQFSENMTIYDVDFETDKSTGRTTAGYADFIQMSGCKGLIDVSECTFSNPHDDPINIHGTFLQVINISSDRKQVTVQYKHNETAGFPNFYVGNQIEFATRGNMVPVSVGGEIFTAEIVKVDGPDGMGGNMGNGSGSLTNIILTLDKAIPSAVTANNSHVVENITYTPEVHVYNNIFKETPTRGILCTTRGEVVIEDNVFDNMGMAAIYISNDAQGWYESGRTTDVTIRNNEFIINPLTGGAPAILVEPTNGNVNGTIHNNMTIEGNTFYMIQSQPVLNAKCVNNLVFADNAVYRQNPNVKFTVKTTDTSLAVGESDKMTATVSEGSLGSRLYVFNGCTNVTVENNTYDNGLNAGSTLYSTSADQIDVQNDEMRVNADNRLNQSATVRFESSNEEVVTVAANGTVKAVAAGTADVNAYAIIGGRKFESEPVTYKVTGTDKAEDVVPTEVDVKSANAFLAEAQFEGLDDEFVRFDKNELYYQTTAKVEETEISMHFEAMDENASVDVLLNGEAVEDLENVTLSCGINIVEVTVAAEDGITKRPYRFVILRTGDSNAALEELIVDGTSVELQKDLYSYSVSLGEGTEAAVVETKAASRNAKTVMTINGKLVKDGNVALEPGMNKVTIVVSPETASVPTRYQLTLKVFDPENANLEAVDFNNGLKLNETFDAAQLNYTGVSSAQEITFNAAAEEAQATVSIFINGKMAAIGKGTAEGELVLAADDNKIEVKVVSPNGSQNEVYTFDVKCVSMVYISDLDYKSKSSVGWGSIMKDQDVDGDNRVLELLDETGAIVAFEKGMGAHADSYLYYDLTDKGYQTFESYIGVDADQGGLGSVTFEVLVDGTSVFKSRELTSSDTMVKVSIPLDEDAKEICLKATKGANDANDHATWADAKFLSEFEGSVGSEEVDTNDLEAAVADAKALDMDSYTEETVAVLQSALQLAEEALESGMTNQEVCDELTALVTEAVNNLEEVIQIRFDDVPDGKWYTDAVYWGVKNKIVNGLTDTLFGPKDPCTRGQIVTLLWRAEGEPEPVNRTHGFTDVEEGKYYYDAMLWAVEKGIATGYTDTTFAPNETCTRAQMATFIYRHAGEQPVDGNSNPFNDIQEGKWYYNAAIWASENNVVTGYEGGLFAPNDTVTRDQTVVMLYRYFK